MTTQHTPGPWFIWKERAMQDEGDIDAEEIFEELSEYESFQVMAGEPIGKVTRSLIRGCKTITDVDSMNFGETEDEGRQIALANARLIAAAPELLEALKWAMKRIGQKAPHEAIEGDGELYAFAVALGAIKKAAGEKTE
jgi:hypothetical protein